MKQGDVASGARTKATVVKNKVAPPFRKVEFDILFNEGINHLGEILDMGVEQGILKRSGTWMSYGDVRLGQGRDRAREFLLENRDMAIEIRRKILEKLHPELVRGSGDDGSEEGGEASEEAPNPAETRAAKSAKACGRAASQRAERRFGQREVLSRGLPRLLVGRLDWLGGAIGWEPRLVGSHG